MRETERRIVRAAEVLFADRGFDVTWTDLAAAANVPPAVVRRYFRNKSLLVDKVFARLAARRWRPEWEAMLANRTAPLERRLIRFFTEYTTHAPRTSTRLAMRAALSDGLANAKAAFDAALARRALLPIVRELRHDAGLPTPEERHILAGELELVHMICGAVTYPNVRLHIFDVPVHGNLAELVAMMVRTWLPGARAEIVRLHRAVQPVLQPAPLLAATHPSSAPSLPHVEVIEEAVCG